MQNTLFCRADILLDMERQYNKKYAYTCILNIFCMNILFYGYQNIKQLLLNYTGKTPNLFTKYRCIRRCGLYLIKDTLSVYLYITDTRIRVLKSLPNTHKGNPSKK